MHTTFICILFCICTYFSVHMGPYVPTVVIYRRIYINRYTHITVGMNIFIYIGCVTLIAHRGAYFVVLSFFSFPPFFVGFVYMAILSFCQYLPLTNECSRISCNRCCIKMHAVATSKHSEHTHIPYKCWHWPCACVPSCSSIRAGSQPQSLQPPIIAVKTIA